MNARRIVTYGGTSARRRFHSDERLGRGAGAAVLWRDVGAEAGGRVAAVLVRVRCRRLDHRHLHAIRERAAAALHPEWRLCSARGGGRQGGPRRAEGEGCEGTQGGGGVLD